MKESLVLYKHQQNLLDDDEITNFRDSMERVTRERSDDISDSPRSATYGLPSNESRIDTYRYYHLSENPNLIKIDPYITDTTTNIARVPFNTSISNCLISMNGNQSGKNYYVYIPASYDFHKAVTPTREQLPAGQITGEIWYTAPVNVKCIGQIHVIKQDDSKPHIYQPDSGSTSISELYEWNYRQIQNEYALLPELNNLPTEQPIIEQAMYSERRCMPVFIILMHSGTPMATVVKMVSRAEYSHCCIAFNPELKPHYSFGLKKLGLNPLHPESIGFTAQNPKDPLYKKYKNTKYSVYVMYVTPKQYGDMQRVLQGFIDNKDKLRYDFVNLISVWLGIQSEESEKWFCSKFIAKVIDAGYKLGKVPSLWMPMDFADLKNVSLCAQGSDFYNYNSNITKLNLELIKARDYTAIQFQMRQFDNSLKQKLGLIPKTESSITEGSLQTKSKVNLELPTKNKPPLRELLDSTPLNHIWCTSDWHMYKDHYKQEKNLVDVNDILKYCRSHLSSKDILLYLGDLSFRYANEEDLSKVRENIRSIPCTKVLILGNHDKMLGQDFFGDCGFDYVYESLSWKDYIFTHVPVNLTTSSEYNIHGHIHDSTVYYTCTGKRHINVYPYFYNNRPINLEYIRNNLDKLTKDHKYVSNAMFGEQSWVIGNLPISETVLSSKSINDMLDDITPGAHKVYFSPVIDGDIILRMVKNIKPELFNDNKKSLIKIHFGERGNKHFVNPEYVKPLALATQSILGDCNVAYESKDKQDTLKHIKLAQQHGFDFCPIDILDSDGEQTLGIPNNNMIQHELKKLKDGKIKQYESSVTIGDHLTETIVGSHLKDYDQLIVFTHFKGHSVAGMGGSIKNIGMGCASAKHGKLNIHGHNWENTGRLFMEKLTESASVIDEYFKDNVIYINILNNLSICCDCENEAPEATMPDIGVLVSTDLLAIEQASYELIKLNKSSHDLMQQIADKAGYHQIEYLKWLCGKSIINYDIYDIDGQLIDKENYSSLANKHYTTEQYVIETDSNLLNRILRFNKETNKFQYGLLKPGENKIIKQNTTYEDYDKYYRMASPEQFVKQDGGICWDYVTYEANWFSTNIPEVRIHSYYIQFYDKKYMPTHTFLVFEYDDKYYWFESAFGALQGIWEARSLKDIFNFAMYNMSMHPKKNPELLKCNFEIREYNPLDRSLIGLGSQQFMEYILNHGTKISHTYNKNFDVKKITNKTISESFFFSSDDILYRANEWENNKSNIAYIVGFSGSGKSTLSDMLSKNNPNCENIELDEVLFNWKYTDSELAKWSTLLYSFFTTVGAQYRRSFNEIKDLDAKSYEIPMIFNLLDFTERYAKIHKNKKFILEGVWPMMFGTRPETFKDWTVFIKGTSYSLSTFRAIRRDIQRGQYFHFARYIAKYRPSLIYYANTIRMNKILNDYINYFNSYI